MALVYRHRRLDNNDVFYVGIASRSDRPISKKYRNSHWHNVVNKAGFNAEIIVDGISIEDAKELECLLISCYGRADLGTGKLVNLTSGGDGLCNISESTKNKMRLSQLGKKQTSEHIKNMHESIKHNKKIVQQFDLNGNFIAEFLGVRNASKCLGMSYRQLQRVIRGERKQTRGFIFKYKG